MLDLTQVLVSLKLLPYCLSLAGFDSSSESSSRSVSVVIGGLAHRDIVLGHEADVCRTLPSAYADKPVRLRQPQHKHLLAYGKLQLVLLLRRVWIQRPRLLDLIPPLFHFRQVLFGKRRALI